MQLTLQDSNRQVIIASSNLGFSHLRRRQKATSK